MILPHDVFALNAYPEVLSDVLVFESALAFGGERAVGAPGSTPAELCGGEGGGGLSKELFARSCRWPCLMMTDPDHWRIPRVGVGTGRQAVLTFGFPPLIKNADAGHTRPSPPAPLPYAHGDRPTLGVARDAHDHRHHHHHLHHRHRHCHRHRDRTHHHRSHHHRDIPTAAAERHDVS